MNAVAKATRTDVSTWEGFETELRSREQAIVSMLPNHVSRERFINSAIAAVKQTPELLNATPRSLFGAVTKSAQDGLLPDGREGVITLYNEKQKDNSWQKTAQWNPMAYGLRKRARELDNIIIDAQVVYENDDFMRHQGDAPHIEHRPANLGTPRGAMIGAYAIFKSGDGTILHREVMDAAQIQAVRDQSKAPNSLMWTKFAEEGWRKTVVRRGVKTVPCSERLQTIVQRDDDLFNFDVDHAHPPDRAKAKVIQSQGNGTSKALPPVVGESQDLPADPFEQGRQAYRDGVGFRKAPDLSETDLTAWRRGWQAEERSFHTGEPVEINLQADHTDGEPAGDDGAEGGTEPNILGAG
jgi:recombination protein RecT